MSNRALLATVEKSIGTIQRSKVLRVLHASPLLQLNTPPVPLASLVKLTELVWSPGFSITTAPAGTRTLRVQSAGLDTNSRVNCEPSDPVRQ